MATQADIDALNRAIATGEKIVKFNGKLVEYRSVDELIRAKSEIQRQLNDASTANRGRQTVLVRKGDR
jgi:hypothetical protein